MLANSMHRIAPRFAQSRCEQTPPSPPLPLAPPPKRTPLHPLGSETRRSVLIPPRAAISSLNKVILMGTLGRDAEFRPSAANATAAPDAPHRGVWSFSLATNRNIKRGDEWVQQTQWHNVKAIADEHSALHQKLVKGSVALVEGRIDYYKSEESQKFYTRILADKVSIQSLPQRVEAPHEEAATA